MWYRVLFVFIICVAVFLRFFSLGTNVPLTWDEVSWGYNAYTLGIDGRDEYGVLLPWQFLESFGDYKPPMYAYLTVIPVWLFGVNEFSTRFASAFFGVLTVLLTYALTRELFPRSTRSLGLVAMGIMAVSPWHIMLSRAAFEANVATFFIVCGMWTLVRWSNTQQWFLLIHTAVCWALSFYTFNSARIVSVLLAIASALIFWRTVRSNWKQCILASVVGFVLVAPLVPFLLSPQASLRFNEVNIFSNPEIIETANQKIANDDGAWYSTILNNRRVAYAMEYLTHYFDHFTPRFLFISGDTNPKFSIQDVGQLYLIELPFLIVGMLVLIRQREGRAWLLLPVWCLIAVIPAAVARETPHALRIAGMLPVLQILVACGIVYSCMYLRKSKALFLYTAGIVIVAVLYGVSVSYFGYKLFRQYPYLYAKEWQTGYKEAITYVREHEANVDEIVIENYLGRPQIYTAFYRPFSVSDFRSQSVVERDQFGLVNPQRLGKYVFTNTMSFPADGKRRLVVRRYGDYQKPETIERTIYTPLGEPYIVIYQL